MLYRFSHFEFNESNLVLTQNGKTITIRHNEARVLAFLLKNKDRVVSKEEILSDVWQGKVVSEQAVFQNISHLRNVLGDDVIRTFPKLGYQWIAETECVTNTQGNSTNEVMTGGSSESLEGENLSVTKPSTKTPIYAFALVIMFIMVLAMWPTKHDGQQNKFSLAYIPVAVPGSEKRLKFEDTDKLDFSEFARLEHREFVNQSELLYPELSKTHPYILTARVWQSEQSWYMDFLLKGPGAEWDGLLTANNQSELSNLLKEHLSQNFIVEFTECPLSVELQIAQLSLAHQQSPNDLNVLSRLVITYINQNELEKAMVLAEKYANSAFEQRNTQQLGRALMLQGDVLSRKDLFQLSAEKLDLAEEKLEQVNDLHRLSDLWLLRARLDHYEGSYQNVRKSLLTAADLAKQVADVERELDALTYLSVMALKHKQHDDKYEFLTLAENKMREYQLPEYQFSRIPMHYAIYAKNQPDKEPHLKQVLKFTKLTPNHWTAKASREQLMLFYIQQNRMEEAEALLNGLAEDRAHTLYLKALLANAQQDSESFLGYAHKSFELAQLAGEQKLSLDVALLLCSNEKQQINFDFYSQFISENATADWRQINKEKLYGLNL